METAARLEESTRLSPWPANARFEPDGLRVSAVSARNLAREFGTPLIVIDEEDVRTRCRAFAGIPAGALFAVKAFPARVMIRLVLEESLGLLVASGGELMACLRAGADPAHIAFHGNNKSDSELELAVSNRIGLVIADNSEELARLDGCSRAIGAHQPVLIRVAPGVPADTHPSIATGGPGSRFGIPLADGMALDAVARALAAENLEFRGLHAHIGSQLLHPKPYVATLQALIDLVDRCRSAFGAETQVLDLGGGFGVTYTDETPLDAPTLLHALRRGLQQGCAERGLPEPDLLVEPGRAIAANPVLTLYRVGTVKTVSGVGTFVAVDGGMSDNIRPALYGARHAVALAGADRVGPPAMVTIVGKHCESGDVLARDVVLARLPEPGDLLAVAATGAYCYSMASNYNCVGRPAAVAIDGETARLVLRRETDEDLGRLDVPEARA